MPPAPKCTDDIIPSYEVIDGGNAIKFTPCGTVSHNLSDVRNYYCARCGRFMNDGIWAYKNVEKRMK